MRRLLGFFLSLALAAASVPSWAKELVIGLVAPLSGPAAVYGREASGAAQAYFDHLNSTGGINGQQVRLVVRDDQFNAARTVEQVRDLIDNEKALALICGVGTANWIAVTKDGALQRTGTAAVGLMTPATMLRDEPYRNLFFLRPTLKGEIRRIVQQLASTGFTRIGVLYQDDAFGKDALEGLKAAAAEFNVVPDAPVGYNRDAGNVEAGTKAVLAANPNSIVVLGTSGAVAKAVKVARDARFAGQIMATSVVDPRDLVSAAGAEAARGLGLVQVMPNPRSSTLPVSAEFRKLVKATDGSGPSSSNLAMEGYLTAKLVAGAIRKAGRNAGPRDVYRALIEVPRYDLGGFIVGYDSTNRTGSSLADISIINWQGSLLY